MNELPLERLARRASGDPFFLGFRLAEYCRIHNINDAALAARLGCEVAMLATIRLCRTPRSEPASFREDVLDVADTFRLNAKALAEAAKPVFATPTKERGDEQFAVPQALLLAARDREESS